MVQSVGSIELRPGVHFCSAAELNRISRQQGLCLAIAQAAVFDEICRSVELPPYHEEALIREYLDRQGVESANFDAFLESKGWNLEDLRYFATKGERLDLFVREVFQQEVEIRFLERKLDYDQVCYSLIRVADEDLAIELHQRLQEGEATFAELAPQFSQGPERDTGGVIGPVPLTQAHPVVAEKLRISQPGQLWPPFFLVDIWLIVRLESWDGIRLDDAMREEILNDLFHEWLNHRVGELLAGELPSPLPLHLLNRATSFGDSASS